MSAESMVVRSCRALRPSMHTATPSAGRTSRPERIEKARRGVAHTCQHSGLRKQRRTCEALAAVVADVRQRLCRAALGVAEDGSDRQPAALEMPREPIQGITVRAVAPGAEQA